MSESQSSMSYSPRSDGTERVLYLSSSSPLNLKEVMLKTKTKKKQQLVSEVSQRKERSTERENRKKREL